MAIVDIFSKRQERRKSAPDVYVWDTLPQPLRTQIWMLIENACLRQPFTDAADRAVYLPVVQALRLEYGTFHLVGSPHRGLDPYVELMSFFMNTSDVNKALDVVELCFGYLMRYRAQSAPSQIKHDYVAELNARFLEHAVGYELSGGKIVRIDSAYVHAEIVKPALAIVDNKHYCGVQDEFLSAHKHYRDGNYKESLNECLKAFESMMKAICDRRKWSYKNNATAKNLIATCLRHELVPSFWQNHFSSMASMLESGIPAGRNQLSAHGQGTTPMSVPRCIVEYMLHMTASAIVFLERADKDKA